MIILMRDDVRDAIIQQCLKKEGKQAEFGFIGF